MLRTDDLDFHLPEDLIATHPTERRDSSRLLVISRSDPEYLEHRTFAELPSLLSAGDAMVFNRSAVVMARFEGENEATGGRVGGMYLADGAEPGTFVGMVKARRVRVGGRLRVRARDAAADGVTLEIVSRADGGGWVLRVVGPNSVQAFLDRCGLPPLPPYILAARGRSGEETESVEDLERYQTVYAAEAGSVAAPTAGLHFTPEVLGGLDAKGVQRGEVVLHVGRGTFQPVETETVEDHPMHAEWCSLPEPCESMVAQTRASGGRVIAVGTTSARTLESFAIVREQGSGVREHETDILITPGYEWRWVDGLVTNFHLPRSTLLAMVSSLLDGIDDSGVERLLEVYKIAIEERYRFFSYGDAMLILP